MSRQQSKYVRVDPQNPECAGQCDLCGRWYQLRELQQQTEWAGNRIFAFNSLRCSECLDIPNEQFRSLTLPVDPAPVLNARVPNFAYEEQTVMIAQNGDPSGPPWAAGPQLMLCDQTGELPLILQYLTSS